MRDIYKEAEQVLIWLGLPTHDTNLSMDFIRGYQQRLRIQRNGVPQANLWTDTWLRSNSKEHPQRNGLRELLSRPWFRRIWVLQEVANARVATIICGQKSISSRIFALAPSILNIQTDEHCQAVLDIMPGPGREQSWWTKRRDIYTLLRKFRKSKATD